MAGAKKLEVQIIGDASSLSKAFKGASASAGGFGKTLGRTAKYAGIALGAAGIGGLALVLKQGTQEFMQASKVSAQTGAALKSTGGIANVTAGQISALAQQQMRLTGVDDELIQSGENLLLTFKNVRNEVGEGNKVFDRATVAALDLSQAGFGSIESASKMMGKALNDPIKGMTALGRAGVTFSDDQKKTIKALVTTGDLLGAQKIILKEVESQVGGSAKAYGTTLPGQLKILKESFNNLAGSLVSSLMPAFSKATAVASKFVSDLSAAKGWRAKLNIVWEGLQEAAQKLTTAVGSAVAGIDWNAAWNKARGIGEGLAARFAAIDWTAVGKTIGDGIAAGMSTASSFGPKIAESVLAASRTIDWVALGKAMGPGLAAALATAFVTLMDPGFWAKNWDLALAVFLAAFGKGIGKIVAPVGRLLVRFGGDAVLAIVAGIEAMSPKIASVLLAVLTKLPSLVSKALGLLLAPVKAVFAKLGALATFVVKVLGVQAAIQAVVAFGGKVKEWLDRVVDWFTGLPGRIKGAIPSPGSLLTGIGSAIIGGLLDGLKAKWESVKGFLSSLGGAIKSLKGPLAKDKVLLFQEGHAIMTGLGEGMQAGWVRNVQFLRGVSAGILREINAIQGQLDAINLRRETQDRAAAVRDATAALAEARKKKEGVAAAELALARAREDIAVAGLTAQLTKEQALYDRRALMIQGKMDKLQAILQRAQDKAAALFDRMQAKIMRAFDATRGGIVTPAEAALAAINDARRNNDLQKALAEAVASGDTEAILRAQEDIQIASLERQAANERTALDQQTEAMREKLEDKLATMLTVWKGGTASILELLKGYGIDFANVGALLGDAFRQSLLDAITGAGKAKVAVQAATANVARGGRMPAMASGGRVLSDGAAFLHRGETVVPARASSGGGWGNGDIVIKIGEDEIARASRNGNNRYYRANGRD